MRSRTRSAARHPCAGLLTVALLVLGIAWMHTLAGAPLPPASTAVAVAVMPDCATGGHHDPCPATPHDGGHAGAMCQSPLPPAIGAPAPTFAASPPLPPAAPDRALTVTVAAEAAGGSGCGPPQRSVLSIWRT
ncbi:hypothetical protein [Dactylosporangium aurantiacum]|uniref:hypothetical protein n=1 Tax=Dactylosporangium aurantiacum TaxID=35754 RepID=UPI00138E2498|nr:hypothetical protein [Dactylosporangium aurantiacum]MDG6108749.1 hypothetical protein [Dactylosporangium aurantiacum]